MLGQMWSSMRQACLSGKQPLTRPFDKALRPGSGQAQDRSRRKGTALRRGPSAGLRGASGQALRRAQGAALRLIAAAGLVLSSLPLSVLAPPSSPLAPQAAVAVAPAITSLSPHFGAVGTQVTISGSGFGADPGPGNRGSASNRVLIDGRGTVPDANVLSWSDTAIVFKVPVDRAVPISGAVRVQAAGVSSGLACFRVAAADGPCIQAGAPIPAPRPGHPVTITGSLFANGELVTLRWNDPAATPLATVNAGVSGNFTQTVIVPIDARIGPHTILASAPSGSDGTRVIVAAAITCTTPDSGAAGTLVTLTGKDFGAVQGGSAVNFRDAGGKSIAGFVQSWNNTQITVKAPPGVATGNVSAEIGGVQRNDVQFVVGTPGTAPAITCVSLSGGAATITGSNFGATQGSSTVAFTMATGSGVVGTPSSWTNTSIVVPVPGSAVNGSVRVHVMLPTLAIVSSNGVTYEITPSTGGAPQLSLSPDNGKAGTTSTTVTGANFTPGQQVTLHLSSGLDVLATATVQPGGTFSQAVTIPAFADPGKTSIRARVLTHFAQSAGFKVTPFIQSVSPGFGLGGTVVTINGLGFGADPGVMKTD